VWSASIASLAINIHKLRKVADTSAQPCCFYVELIQGVVANTRTMAHARTLKISAIESDSDANGSGLWPRTWRVASGEWARPLPRDLLQQRQWPRPRARRQRAPSQHWSVGVCARTPKIPSPLKSKDDDKFYDVPGLDPHIIFVCAWPTQRGPDHSAWSTRPHRS